LRCILVAAAAKARTGLVRVNDLDAALQRAKLADGSAAHRVSRAQERIRVAVADTEGNLITVAELTT
jgi:hypothetical protein